MSGPPSFRFLLERIGGFSHEKSTLCENRPTLGLWNRPAELLGRPDPFPDHDLRVVDSLLVCGAISHASRELGDLDKEGFVLVTPADDHAIVYQPLAP